MSYPDEEKDRDYNEIFCGIMLLLWFGVTISFLLIGLYSWITA